MADAVARHGVALRPHMKTAKCAEVARMATAGQAGGITVSPLAEAAFFAEAGLVRPSRRVLRTLLRMRYIVDATHNSSSS
jgi:D-serine deaminase-like pyridoxal phosphate-dependent protein